jgi:hypothetical protein
MLVPKDLFSLHKKSFTFLAGGFIICLTTTKDLVYGFIDIIEFAYSMTLYSQGSMRFWLSECVVSRQSTGPSRWKISM